MRLFWFALGFFAAGCDARTTTSEDHSDASVATALLGQPPRHPVGSLGPDPIAKVTFPARADGATEIATARVRASVRLIGAASVEGKGDGDRVRFAHAYAGADVEHVRTDLGEEDFVHFAAKPKESLVRWSFETTGVAGLRLVANILELLDADGMPRLRVPEPFVIDATGARRTAKLEVEGCVVDRDVRPAWGRALIAPRARCELVVRWTDDGLAYPLTLDPAWTTTGSLATARRGHTAVMVQAAGACSAGCVVVIGGRNGGFDSLVPEVYNAASGTWTNAPYPNGFPLMADYDIAGAEATGGTALFAGGFVSGGGYSAVAARWNASTLTWTATSGLPWFVAGASMATLPGHGALLVGGQSESGYLRGAVTWSKATDNWTVSSLTALYAGRRTPLLAVYQSPTAPTKVTACAIGGISSGFPTSGVECIALEISAAPSGTWTNYSSFNPNINNYPTMLAMAGSFAYAVAKNGSIQFADLAAIGDEMRFVPCSGTCPPKFGSISGVTTSAIDERRAVSLSTDRMMFVGGSAWDPTTSAPKASTVVDYLLPGATPTAAVSSMVRSSGALAVGRTEHTATALPNGRVLVVGGTVLPVPYSPVVTASVELFGPIPKGSSCATHFECDVGLSCVEGVCCALAGASKTNCTDTCESCLVAGKVGTCSPRPARALPEVGHGSCPNPSGGSCGYTCDGSNRAACAVAGTAASCASATCTDGTTGPSAFTPTSSCDGAGGCTYASPGNCGKYKCASATACRTMCTGNGDCTDGNKCSGGACVDAGDRGATCVATSDCLPGLGLTCVDSVCCAATSCPSGFSCAVGGGFCKKPLGGACTSGTATDCASGECAPDGVCCNTACVGQCEECKATGTIGTCTPRPSLTDPIGGRTACGGSGDCRSTCDGTTRTACGPYPSKLKNCGAAACVTSTSIAQEASFCDGSGACVAGASSGCSPYKCSGTACGKTCTATTDCLSGYFCDTAKSLCVTSGDPGSTCASTSQCKTGSCVDGVCCSTATCALGLTCAANGKGTCSKPLGASCSLATDCGSGFCADGVCCNAACNGSCESCSLTGYAGSCTPVPSGGDAKHGTCPGTGSCRSKCDGTTRASCGALPGVSTACAGTSCTDGKLTGTSYCDGLGACATPAPSTCTPYKCGSTSACGLSCSTTADCGAGYACNANKCETTGALGTFCDEPTQCKSNKCVAAVSPGKTVCCSVDSCPAGTFCGEAGTAGAGTCVARGGSACTDPNQCANGFCIDGVCCDAACGGQCQACDVPSALGKCVAVSGAPHGSRATCSNGAGDVCKAQSCDGVDGTKCAAFTNGPAVECSRACADEATVAIGKCDGAGVCGSGKAASCAGFKCDAGGCRTSCTGNDQCSSGYYCNGGTSRCEPALGKCSDDRSKSTSADGTVVTTCFPFLCDAGSGGCAKTCASTVADCAAGQTCSERVCVSGPPPTEDGGGCAVQSPGGRRAGLGLAAFLALSVFARRRRRLRA